MLFATVGQGALFVWMVLAGIAIGAWYTLMALVRRILQSGFWLTFACDLVFGIGSAGILLFFLFLGNYGQLRFYSILGVCSGIALFYFALTRPLQGLLSHIQKTGKQIAANLSKNRLIKVIFK